MKSIHGQDVIGRPNVRNITEREPRKLGWRATSSMGASRRLAPGLRGAADSFRPLDHLLGDFPHGVVRRMVRLRINLREGLFRRRISDVEVLPHVIRGCASCVQIHPVPIKRITKNRIFFRRPLFSRAGRLPFYARHVACVSFVGYFLRLTSTTGPNLRRLSVAVDAWRWVCRSWGMSEF